MCVCVCVCVHDSEDSQETATWASLIVIAGVICIAIVVAVAVLLKRTAFYRKQAKYYDELHRYSTHLQLINASHIYRPLPWSVCVLNCLTVSNTVENAIFDYIAFNVLWHSEYSFYVLTV